MTETRQRTRALALSTGIESVERLELVLLGVLLLGVLLRHITGS